MQESLQDLTDHRDWGQNFFSADLVKHGKSKRKKKLKQHYLYENQ